MDNYTQNLINQQIALWEKESKDSTFKSNYINLWKLIGGRIDDVCYGLNSWKRTFAIFVWFANGGMDDFKESLEKYEQILESQRQQEIIHKEDLISEPLPAYFEEQLYKEDERNKYQEGETDRIFESFDMKQKPKHLDVVYHLFKYYVDHSYAKSKIFSPQNISSDMLDYRLPWLINFVLTKITGQNEEDKKIQDQLTVSLAFQLENLGMWDWACYVCLFINNRYGREKAIKNLLFRYYPVEDHSGSVYEELCLSSENKKEEEEEDFSITSNTVSNSDEDATVDSDSKKDNQNSHRLWTFLVDRLKIPKMWIHEARIMKAQYQHDVVLEAIYLIDAQCWDQVHSLVINEILPEAIINNNTDFVERILKKIPPENVKDWNNGGALFLKYLEIINSSSSSSRINTINSKELLDQLHSILRSIQKQLSVQNKTSTSYEALLKRKICLDFMCKEILKHIEDHEANKENNDLILSFSIPENQRLYNVKKYRYFS